MPPTDAQHKFVSRLDSLSAGQRAALRRAGARPFHEASGEALSAFTRVAPNVRYNEDRWFYTACWCMHFDSFSDKLSLPAQLRQLASEGANTLERRMINVLDETWSDDSLLITHLNRLITMLSAKRSAIDGAQLLYDLEHWNHPNRFVQRSWARTFFGYEMKEED